MVEVVFATVDHSLIFAGRNRIIVIRREALDYKRGFCPKTYRIELSRILLSVYPSTTTYAASFEFLQNKFTLSRPPQRLLLCCFCFDPDGPDKTQQLTSHRRHHNTFVLTLGQQLSIALMQPLLRFPRDLFDLFADMRLPLPQLGPHGRSVPVGPRSFHNHPS